MRSNNVLLLIPTMLVIRSIDAFVGTKIHQQARRFIRPRKLDMVASQMAVEPDYISFSADTGFLVSPSALSAVLDRFELRRRLGILLNNIDTNDADDLRERGYQARHLIMNAGLPKDVEDSIKVAYSELCQDICNAGYEFPSVQVRTAPADVWPDQAFAGQQASAVDVSGVEDVGESILECFASIFSDEAIKYRQENGNDHLSVHGAVAVSRTDVARRAWSQAASSSYDDTTSSFDSVPGNDFRKVTVLRHHSFRPRMA